jgi:hypothetical protein
VIDAASVLSRPSPDHLGWCRSALSWYFGRGSVAVLPGAIVPASYGIRGKAGQVHITGTGNSEPSVNPPNGDLIKRFGHVDSALIKIGEAHRTVLALAFGDAGAIATNGGLFRSRRWRAVAPLAPAAVERGAAWVAERDRMPEGPTSRLDVIVQQTERLEGIRASGEPARANPHDDAWQARLGEIHAACPPPAEPPAPSKAPKVTPPPWQRKTVPSKRLTEEEILRRLTQEEQRRDRGAGPPSFRWLEWVFDPESKPTRQDRLAAAQAEQEAVALIASAEHAFAHVYVPTHEDKRR